MKNPKAYGDLVFRSGFAIDNVSEKIRLGDLAPDTTWQRHGINVKYCMTFADDEATPVLQTNAGAYAANGMLICVDLEGEPLPANTRYIGGIARDDLGRIYVDSVSDKKFAMDGLWHVASGALAGYYAKDPVDGLNILFNGDAWVTASGDQVVT